MARIRSLDKLTLKEMIMNFQEYRGLPDGLIQLPLPENIGFGTKKKAVPQTFKDFTDSLCYGQRIFLTQKEEDDFGLIIRAIDGYYYSLVTNKKWNADEALSFGKRVLNCLVKELYPVAIHIISLIGEMIEREQKLLYREPSKMEQAAGIEKLNIFSELTSLDFLRDAMKCTVPEVLLTPYNECLVRFMIAKETAEYQERYYELMKEQSMPKSKYK